MAKLAAILAGAVCGGMGGIVLCIVAGILSPPPPRDPREKLELAAPLVFATYAFFSCAAGGVIGIIVAAAPSVKAFAFTAGGLFVGMLVGYIAWRNGLTIRADPHTIFSGGTMIVLTFAIGLAGSVLGCLFGSNEHRREIDPIPTKKKQRRIAACSPSTSITTPPPPSTPPSSTR